MTIAASTPASSLPLRAAQPSDMDKAVQGFEAIFIRQMLSAARASSDADPIFGSEAQSTFRQMLDDRFAESAAREGAFGIGALLKAHLPKTEG